MRVRPGIGDGGISCGGKEREIPTFETNHAEEFLGKVPPIDEKLVTKIWKWLEGEMKKAEKKDQKNDEKDDETDDEMDI